MTPTPLRLCFALHLHQPVGNFDSVFQQHLDDVYRPLLRTLMDGEFWPVGLHVSGPLLEWLDTHASDFVDHIAQLAIDRKIELLCAGHDEPILAVLSRQDRFDQILHHREWIRTRLGVDTRGLWLTERVWEPSLPGDLASAGVDFALVDDRHFRVTGFAETVLHRHYLTESGGHRVTLFPIDERLRYLIPFRPPHELAEYFRTLRRNGHPLAILGDDGEKFGGWPGTRKWLYDDGWLEGFLGTMRELRDAGEVTLSRFDDAMRQTPSGGLAYLPSASYREMEAWSLPFAPAQALLRLEDAWRGPRLDGVEGGLLRGGHWRNFLVKYPESNRMHKFAMALSGMCRDQGNAPDVRRLIGRAQCNDAYWHGVFGGLYLPFLRGAIWQNLARAEALLRTGDPLELESRDIDADGQDELWVHSCDASLLVAPDRGGVIEVWVDFAAGENLLNVIARHREAYHTLLYPDLVDMPALNTPPTDGAPSIHDLETQLAEVPPVDIDQRGLFVDRALDDRTTVADFIAGTVVPMRSWSQATFDATWSVDGDAARIVMISADLRKVIDVIDAGRILECRWTWEVDTFAHDAWFSTELSYSGDLLLDAPGAERWTYPIETVAKSEKGFDRTVQGTAVVLRWPVSMASATVRVSRAV
jgi:alpha-amylase